ncbi:MAG: hypothetical protein ACJ77A_14115 [Actinomycetota bacterium]
MATAKPDLLTWVRQIDLDGPDPICRTFSGALPDRLRAISMRSNRSGYRRYQNAFHSAEGEWSSAGQSGASGGRLALAAYLAEALIRTFALVRVGRELVACVALAFEASVLGTLSLALYREVNKIQRIEWRTHLADVMGELSGFVTLASAADLLKAEVDQALHRRFGRPPFPRKPEPLGGPRNRGAATPPGA